MYKNTPDNNIYRHALFRQFQANCMRYFCKWTSDGIKCCHCRWINTMLHRRYKSEHGFLPRRSRLSNLVGFSLSVSLYCTFCIRKIAQKGSAFVSFRDTIPFTESAWVPSTSILLIQPYSSGRTCYPFVGWRTHVWRTPYGGLSLPRLRKGIRLRYHRFLRAKLKASGIDGAVLNWIKSYLSNRSYQVKSTASFLRRRPVIVASPKV